MESGASAVCHDLPPPSFLGSRNRNRVRGLFGVSQRSAGGSEPGRVVGKRRRVIVGRRRIERDGRLDGVHVDCLVVRRRSRLWRRLATAHLVEFLDVEHRRDDGYVADLLVVQRRRS